MKAVRHVRYRPTAIFPLCALTLRVRNANESSSWEVPAIEKNIPQVTTPEVKTYLLCVYKNQKSLIPTVVLICNTSRHSTYVDNNTWTCVLLRDPGLVKPCTSYTETPRKVEIVHFAAQ